jgi:archaellum component FlaF (FlaF/FlaG flagellin family)
MKIRSGILCALFILFMVYAAMAASPSVTTTSSASSSSSSSTSTTLSAENALAQVYVSSVTVEPQSFYPYEDGTITVQITNSGSQSVAFSQATIIDDNIILLNPDANRGMIYLGPGNTMTYTFLVTAKPPEGTYFPIFSVASRDAGSLRYPIKVAIDSKDLRTGISQKPDEFPLNAASPVNVSIFNPRKGLLDSIIITPVGTNADVNPPEKFIASLDAESALEVPFVITPHGNSSVKFHIAYQNGDNDHSTDLILPINIGEYKTGANPIVNNIALIPQGPSYKLTGDVNNAGISDAKALIVTVGPPARAVEPYPEYAIGSLAADDFSSFEINFATSDLSSIPLVITWKDADGNSFKTTKNLDLRTAQSFSTAGSTGSGSGSSGIAGSGQNPGTGPRGGGTSMFGIGGGRGGGIAAFYPVIAGVIILVIGIVLWTKRKWIAKKLKRD